MDRACTFTDACFRQPTPTTPVWLMRQAGRYQPSYQAIRAQYGFFEVCTTAELAAQVTINAVEEFGVDAGILFSDILVPLRAMGVDVELSRNGPRIDAPIRDTSAVERLRVVDPMATMPYVGEAIGLFNSHFGGQVPLIGFVGAPLTLAAYLVEGGHSRNFVELKKLLFSAPKTAHALLDKLAQMVTAHLRYQADAGCKALQVFDTWAGILAPQDFREFALPYLRRIFEELASCTVPRIFFGTNTACLLDDIATLDVEVIGVDWRVELDHAWTKFPTKAIQGNLDPCLLMADQQTIRDRVERLLAQVDARSGYIFNLGHGVLPPTPTENVRFLVQTVHELSTRHPQP